MSQMCGGYGYQPWHPPMADWEIALRQMQQGQNAWHETDAYARHLWMSKTRGAAYVGRKANA
jgi:hypothetical protein